MVVYCVMMHESHVGEFLIKIFSTKQKAQAYIDISEKSDDLEIVKWEVE